MIKKFSAFIFVFLPFLSFGDISVSFHQFKLKNGLEVILVPQESSLVSVQLFYKVGSAHENPKLQGISHFLEHMMFKTTKDLKAGEFSLTIKSHGGYDNAATTFDYTTYYHVLPATKLETGLKLEAQRMAFITFDEKEIESERMVVIEERHNRYENTPFGFLWEKANEVFFKGKPYGLPIIGYDSTIKAIQKADLKAFYQQYYSPSNAVLLVAGSFNQEKTKKLIQDIFENIPSFKTPSPKKVKNTPPVYNKTPYVFEKDVQTTYGLALFSMPPATHPLSSAFLALDSILFQGQNSLLNQKLVLDERLCFDIGGGSYLRKLDSAYMFYFMPVSADSSSKIIHTFKETLIALKNHPHLDDLLKKARLFILTNHYKDLQKVDGLSKTLGWGYVIKEPKFGFNLYNKVETLTKQELLEAVDWLLQQEVAVFLLNPTKK